MLRCRSEPWIPCTKGKWRQAYFAGRIMRDISTDHRVVCMWADSGDHQISARFRWSAEPFARTSIHFCRHFMCTWATEPEHLHGVIKGSPHNLPSVPQQILHVRGGTTT
eukprot:790211-Rhodomonas_salina.1